MSELLINTLLWGGVVTILAILQGIILDKYLQLNYKQLVTEPMGRLFSRVWGFNAFMLGALMIVASQKAEFAVTIAIAAIFSKCLLLLSILFTNKGSLRGPMKMVLLVDTIIVILLIIGLSPDAIKPTRFQPIDQNTSTIIDNIKEDSRLEKVIIIDHSRLAGKAQQPFSPSEIIMFHDKSLEVSLIKNHQLVAMEMPLKVLSYERTLNNPSVIWDRPEYIESRYSFQMSIVQKEIYNSAIKAALKNIPEDQYSYFSQDSMKEKGIITHGSQYSFDDTVKKALDIIKSNNDVTVFKIIDYQSIAKELGVSIRPTTLIMFGAPAPGGKSMRNAQTLGLDAFPQKFLVYETKSGEINISYNNLVDLANRQGVPIAIALRVIQYRLNKSFTSAFTGK